MNYECAARYCHNAPQEGSSYCSKQCETTSYTENQSPPEEDSPMSSLKKIELIAAVDELARMYKITLSTQHLIQVSRVPEAQQTDEWERNRKKLQKHIEDLCTAPVSPHLEKLGMHLRDSIAVMRPGDVWKLQARQK